VLGHPLYVALTAPKESTHKPGGFWSGHIRYVFEVGCRIYSSLRCRMMKERQRNNDVTEV